MQGLGWIASIIVGGLAGWIASSIMGTHTGIIANIIVGIVGGMVGNWLLEWRASTCARAMRSHRESRRW